MPQHIWNVLNKEMLVDAEGRIHIPKDWRRKLNIGARDKVLLYAGFNEIIMRKKTVRDSENGFYVKTIDTVGKLLLPKTLRQRFSVDAGTLVLVSLFEGYDEIRVKRVRKKRDVKRFP